jgi:hypothetical protein
MKLTIGELKRVINEAAEGLDDLQDMIDAMITFGNAHGLYGVRELENMTPEELQEIIDEGEETPDLNSEPFEGYEVVWIDVYDGKMYAISKDEKTWSGPDGGHIKVSPADLRKWATMKDPPIHIP